MIPMPREDTPVWTDAEPLECVMVIPEAPDVKTFSFRPGREGGRAQLMPGGSLAMLTPTRIQNRAGLTR